MDDVINNSRGMGKVMSRSFFGKAAASLIAGSASLLACGGLSEDFADPQGAVRENTGPLFWLHGTESEPLLREYVGRVSESGQGILTIESRPHNDWMRKGWWRDVDIVLDECRRRGMKMAVFDDLWWPSQGMGGKYPIPEKFQCRTIHADVYWCGEEPKKVENEIARVQVKEIDKGVFSVGPHGDKTIVFTHALPRKKGDLGSFRFPTVNGLDEAAVDWFIENYYQPYYNRYASAFRDGTIPGFFFDEPQFRSFWGPALEKELKDRGENIGELLVALKFRLQEDEDQARAKYRYLDARAEIWGRTMYGRISAWCDAHGVYSSGHFLEHSTAYYDLTLAGGNVMQQMKYVTVPGVDLVCRQYYPHQRESRKRQIAFGQMPKYASSVAHVYNRHNGLNWCEIFGAYFQDLTYPQMKWLCDWHQYQGCYYLIPHSFNPRSPYDRDCPPYFYNGGYEPRYPLFRVWADYNNRCALLLSDGEHVCHIAQCVPGISYHVGKTIRPEMLAFAIQDAQLDSDWMGYDVVELARIGVNPRSGRPALRTQRGIEWYDVLTLPATEYVPFPVLKKALAFAKAGGVVVGYGIRPCNTPTTDKTAKEVQDVVAKIFEQPTAIFIDGEPDGAKLRAALARPYPGGSGPLALRQFDFEGLSPADGRMLAVNHYVKDGAETLFIANQDHKCRRDVMLRTDWPAEKAELWDPMQGTAERPNVVNGLVKLSLEPSAAAFLVWPKKPRTNLLPRVDAPVGECVAATVKKTVTPVVIPGAESGKEIDRTFDGASWIWHPKDSRAEGSVTFRAHVDASAATEANLVFSCDNSAEVFVNGASVAVQKDGTNLDAWRIPTKAKVALKAGRNDIVVKAGNAIPGYAGLVASLTWKGGSLRTDDKAWEVSRDGAEFVKAARVGRYGAEPWGRFSTTRKCTCSPFAESVATELAFTLPKLGDGDRVYLVCDDVDGEKSAAVTVNGSHAGGFIGAPYRVDVTKSVKEGANTLLAKPFRLKNPRIVIVRK